MRTIVALSDSHYLSVPERLKAIIDESDYFFFLGDGESHVSEFLFKKGFYAVSGNCDSGSYPREVTIEIDGVKILLTHGDPYGVRQGLLKLKLRAQELGATLVFFGHTHLAEIVEEDGITFVNPGALSFPASGTPSYAYVVLTDNKCVAKIVDLV